MTDLKSWRDHGPQLIEQALPLGICEEILEYFVANDPRPRSYQGVVDDRLRRCEFVPLDDPKLAARVHALKEPLSESYGTTLSLIDGQVPLIYRYGVGVGFVTHHDEVTEIEIARAANNGQPVLHGDITVSISLSPPEDYTGGELYFVEPEVEFKLAMGGLVTFPATRRVLHGVRPISSGHRFAMILRFRASEPGGQK
jgi:PKHD-type hydroxylase